MKQKRRGRPPKKNNNLGLELHKETKRSLMIVVLIALAVLTAFSLMDITGSVGRSIVNILRLLFGWGAFLIPVLFALAAVSLYKDLEEKSKEKKDSSSAHTYAGTGMLTLVLITLLQLLASTDIANQFELARQGTGGGFIGAAINFAILKTIGPWAGFVLLVIGIVAAVLIAFNIPITALFSFLKKNESEEKEEKQEEVGKKEKSPIKINDLASTNEFNVEKVQKANPVAAALNEEQDKPMPNFIKNGNGKKTKEPDSTPALTAKPRSTSWKFPPLDIFETSNTQVDSGNIEAAVATIEQTLANFDIEVEMGEVNIGPTVTQYTLRPAEGTRLSAIVALQNDLKLALAAPSIRIEAPIPGRSLVGIEVPNKTKAMVRLRELLESEQFSEGGSPLSFIVGRDVAGKAVVEDITKMPHLLIAGATGSGKSVSINVLITSLLMRNTPEDVKMILIDPKRVEMSLYNDIPHLITPIITDHQKAINSLRWTVAEMDRRYKLLQEAHKRNISEYNSSTAEPLSYLVVVVDELADLMSVARNEVEGAVVRLAQMARAVGIHLVLATQRPSVDIITGLIKANITSRIAFAVASQVDSRTILDQSGAEKLLGKGDMLFTSSELPQPKRVQGAFMNEKEVKKLTDFLKKQANPDYDEEVVEKKQAVGVSGGLDGIDEDEPLLEEAQSLVVEAGKASASFLQRKLRIGYARAARILDILEEQGIVGPQEGSKARDVYAVPDEGQQHELGSEETF